MKYEEINWKNHPSDDTPLNAENLNHMEAGIKKAAEEITKTQEKLENIVDIVYPVGAIYLSVSNVNPGSFFGGIWTQFAIGRTIIGINPDDENFNHTEKTGGSKAKGIKEENLPAHKHTFTPEGEIEEREIQGKTRYSEVPHGHDIYGGVSLSNITGYKALKIEDIVESKYNIFFDEPEDGVRTGYARTETLHSHYFDVPPHGHGFTGKTKETGYVGESKEMDILPPYVTCYIWKRVK